MEDKIVKNILTLLLKIRLKQLSRFIGHKGESKIGTNNNSSSSRIIFPLKRESKDNKEEFRISEQELRFVLWRNSISIAQKMGCLLFCGNAYKQKV